MSRSQEKLENQMIDLIEKINGSENKIKKIDYSVNSGKKDSYNGTIRRQLLEIFIINHKDHLKQDLIQFLHREFEKHNLKSVSMNTSVVDYKIGDWVERISDNIINRLIQYFDTIRGQTERDLKSSIPIAKD